MIRRTVCCVAALLLVQACAREPVERAPGAIPVRIEVAKRSAFVPESTMTGTVRVAESIPLVVAKPGTLAYPPRFAAGLRTGESVREGELIAEIRNDQARSALAQARLQMEAAQADYQREKRSFEQGVSSSAEFSSYEVRAKLAREVFAAAQKENERLRITAPRTGQLVVSKPVAAGATVEQGAVLGEIAVRNTPVVEASVAAADREQIRPGLPVNISRIGWSTTGIVREVASVVDTGGTVRVVVGINGSNSPAPGTGVDMRVQLERRPDVITLPEEAIVAGSEGPAVFVISGSEGWTRAFRVKRVPVETGGHASGRVEIRSGVNDGDRVVVSGADALSDDSVVTEASETKS